MQRLKSIKSKAKIKKTTTKNKHCHSGNGTHLRTSLYFNCQVDDLGLSLIKCYCTEGRQRYLVISVGFNLLLSCKENGLGGFCQKTAGRPTIIA